MRETSTSATMCVCERERDGEVDSERERDRERYLELSLSWGICCCFELMPSLGKHRKGPFTDQTKQAMVTLRGMSWLPFQKLNLSSTIQNMPIAIIKPAFLLLLSF